MATRERTAAKAATTAPPPLDPAKERIKTELRLRIRFLSNDCRTLWRVRLERSIWYENNHADQSRPIGLGGGNFVMALAMLSACNLLAKGHVWLKKSEMFVTRADVDAVIAAVAEAKQNPNLAAVLGNNKTRWGEPFLGSCNESSAFAMLVKALRKDGIDLGVPNGDASKVWKDFRNRLAHMAHVSGTATVYTTGRPQFKPKAAEAWIKNGPKAFVKENGRWICMVDRLSLDILDICEWLCRKLDACTELKHVRSFERWLFDEKQAISDPPK